MDSSISENAIPDKGHSMEEKSSSIENNSNTCPSPTSLHDWNKSLDEQLDELSDDSDSEEGPNVDEEVSQYIRMINHDLNETRSTSCLRKHLGPLCQENRKLRKLFNGYDSGYKLLQATVKDHKEDVQLKSTECDNLLRNLAIMKDKLDKSEAKSESQQKCFKDKERQFIAREKSLEADLRAALKRVNSLEENLKRFNSSSTKLSSMLGACKGPRDTRGLGYKGIDAPSTEKINFVKAVNGSSEEKQVAAEKDKVRSLPTNAQKGMYRSPIQCNFCGKRGHTEQKCYARKRSEKLQNILVWMAKEVVKPLGQIGRSSFTPFYREKNGVRNSYQSRSTFRNRKEDGNNSTDTVCQPLKRRRNRRKKNILSMEDESRLSNNDCLHVNNRVADLKVCINQLRRNIKKAHIVKTGTSTYPYAGTSLVSDNYDLDDNGEVICDEQSAHLTLD